MFFSQFAVEELDWPAQIVTSTPSNINESDLITHQQCWTSLILQPVLSGGCYCNRLIWMKILFRLIWMKCLCVHILLAMQCNKMPQINVSLQPEEMRSSLWAEMPLHRWKYLLLEVKLMLQKVEMRSIFPSSRRIIAARGKATTRRTAKPESSLRVEMALPCVEKSFPGIPPINFIWPSIKISLNWVIIFYYSTWYSCKLHI